MYTATAAHAPAGSGTRAVHVQPADLAEFDRHRSARRLQILENDLAVMLELSLTGRRGPVWDKVANALAEYGYAVIGAWVRTGVIFAKCSTKGIHVEHDVNFDRFSDVDVDELTADTVSQALIDFRDRVLANNIWDPTKGASLSTFFIGNCLLRFPNRYRRWRTTRRRMLRSEVIVDDRHASAGNPERELLERLDRDAALATVTSPTNREMLVLKAAGYTHAEIANMMATTVKAIESRLDRLHRAHKKAS